MPVGTPTAVASLPESPRVARSAPPAIRFGLRQLFEVTTCVAVVVWALQSSAAYYQVFGGAALSSLAFIALTGAAGLLVLSFVVRARTVCRLAVLALALFAMRQAHWTHRLAALRREVDSIIAYVDAYKLQRGVYPADLAQYEFRRPDLAPLVEYRDGFPNTSYEIRWHPVAQDGVAHWYGSDYGHYFEDD